MTKACQDLASVQMVDKYDYQILKEKNLDLNRNDQPDDASSKDTCFISFHEVRQGLVTASCPIQITPPCMCKSLLSSLGFTIPLCLLSSTVCSVTAVTSGIS